MSNRDSTFKKNKGFKIGKKIIHNNAVFEPVMLSHHQGLRFIDAFAKNLKRVLSKEFVDIKSRKYINILPGIVERYTNTPHSSLDDVIRRKDDSNTLEHTSSHGLRIYHRPLTRRHSRHSIIQERNREQVR